MNLMDKCWDPPIRPQFPALLIQHLVDILYAGWIIFRSSRPSLKALRFACYFGLFSVGMMMVPILKVVIDDRTCLSVPNSPSGHTFYHIFVALIFAHRFWSGGKYRSGFAKIFMTALLGLHGYNIVIAYIGGYHSIRQILYGAVFAVGLYLFGVALKTFTSFHKLIVFYGAAIIGCGVCANKIARLEPIANITAVSWFPFALFALYMDKKDKIE